MQIPLWQIDAFAERPFSGNPAAVCPLEQWLPEATLQAIAAENNLAETAFFVRRPDGDHDLRWFTPRSEVDLCGHATLASAWVLTWELDRTRTLAVFHTKSGPLTVRRSGEELSLDLPARPPLVVETPAGLARGLGAVPTSTLQARDVVAVFPRAEDVRALRPDMSALEALEGVFGVCVTAPGTGPDADVDFVSRFFAPAKGVPEDPVTGSSHATLVPYWATQLGKQAMRARQVSARGGELRCALERDRVVLTGRAVTVIRGTMTL